MWEAFRLPKDGKPVPYGVSLFCFFLELVGTDTAEGAFVIGGQLVALIDITANNANVLFHVFYLQ